MVSQQNIKGEEYQKLSDAEKLSFLDRGLPFMSALSPKFDSVENIIFMIYAPFIDEVIFQYYVEDDVRKTGGRNESIRFDSIFKLIKRTSNDIFCFNFEMFGL